MKSMKDRTQRTCLSFCAKLFNTTVVCLAAFLCTVVSLGTGAAQSPTRKEIVNVDLPGQIGESRNFNWFTRGNMREYGAHQAMWEPLFVLDDRNGKMEPWLGLEMTPNATQDQWTLKMRDGVMWSDGQIFDANDVIFTANLVINNAELPAAEAADFRSVVESVQKIDNLAVTFKLRKSDPRFAIHNFGGGMFSSFLILPEHIWAGKNPKTFKFDKPIGTGPYKLASVTDTEVVWEQNDKWWGSKLPVIGTNPLFKPLPEPKQLIWRYSADAATSYQAIKANEIDAGRELSPEDFTALKAENPAIIGWDPKLGWFHPCARQLEINLEFAGSAWSNANLRKALSLMIDRQEVADVAYLGMTVPSRTMFAEYGAMEQFIKAVTDANLGLSSRADVAQAQKLVEAEGYAKGANGFYHKDSKVLSLAINVNEDLDLDTKSVGIIVNQLKAAGVAARAVHVSTPELLGTVIPPGNYEAVYSSLSCGSRVEPWTSMTRYTRDKYVAMPHRSPAFGNTGRWNTAGNVAYSAIVDEIGKMPLQVEQPANNGTTGTVLVPNPDIPKRTVDAYKYLSDEMPFIPIVQSVTLIPFNTTYWKGWPTSTDNYTAPMHSWSRTRLMIHQLQKAP